MATLFDSASLVMLPSGYKDDKLYSIKPTDGSGDFTFSRDGAGASPATRVNASGLIEKGRTNNILYSQEYGGSGTANWANVGSATITTDNTIAPDGTITADKLAKASGSTSGVYQIVTTTSGGLYNISVYVKDDSNCDDMLLGCDLNPSNANLRFNPQTGVASSIGAGVIDYSVSNEGSGWYRVSLSYVATGTTNTFLIYNLSAVASSCFAWGAQHENGLVATDYIETTTTAVSAGLLGDMPRLDYSGGATCPSLLLEPSRTNLFTHSEYFGSSDWFKNAATITDNAATSPEGVSNASKLIEATSTNGHFIYQSPTLTAASYTFSVFAKAGERDWLLFRQHTLGLNASFNLSTGTKGTIASGLTADIEDYGNGWYRCSVTFTGTAAAHSMRLYVTTADNSTSSYLGDGTSGIFVYGAQVESGSYPTSYIPTYGEAAQRGNDNCNISSGASSLIGQTEGTAFIEVDYLDGASDDVFHLGRSIINGISLVKQTDSFTARAYYGGTLASAVASSITADSVKVAITYNGSGIKIFVNGVLKASTTASISFTGTINDIHLAANPFLVSKQLKETKQFLVFKTALTDAECIALTTI